MKTLAWKIVLRNESQKLEIAKASRWWYSDSVGMHKKLIKWIIWSKESELELCIEYKTSSWSYLSWLWSKFDKRCTNIWLGSRNWTKVYRSSMSFSESKGNSAWLWDYSCKITPWESTFIGKSLYY